MRTPLQLTLLGLTALSFASVQAADFSDNSVAISSGSNYSNPATNAGNINRTILTFTHFSVDKLGTNLFNVDLLNSASNEPAVGGGGGAQEIYGFYSRDWSLGKITGAKYGDPVRDVSITTRFDFGTKNDAFGGRPLKLAVGPTVSFDVPGFLNVGVYVVKETNHNGIVGKDVSFDMAPSFGAAWGIPISSAVEFKGFVNIVGPKGKDGFGADTATETLAQLKLMADTGALAGGKKNGFLIGVGVEYWNNKFGNSSSATAADTIKQSAPFLQAEYHF